MVKIRCGCTLKEIGNIELLSSDQEFWLSTRLEAARRLDLLVRQHPLARGQAGFAQGLRRVISCSKNKLERVYQEDTPTAWGTLALTST